MTAQMIPNWLRVILLILSFLSFLPQLQRVWLRQDCSGISLYYVLLNLISATEQFTMGFFLLVNNTEGSDVFVETPHTVGDWLNLSQLTVVWVLFLVFFVMCLFYPSDHHISRKIFVSIIYISFLLISVIPLFVDAIDHDIFGPWEPQDPNREWAVVLFSGLHALFISPVVTILSITTLYAQARETLLRPSLQALSLVGLATQAVIFTIVAISWTMRVRFPWNVFEYFSLLYFTTWYQLVGWAAVDNAVFAIVQTVLLWLAIRHTYRHTDRTPSDETEPLLGGHVSVEGGTID